MFGIFKTKRILEVNGRFIPQHLNCFLGWYAIDITDRFKWYDLKYQLEYCSYGTLEEAKEGLSRKVYKIHKV